MIALAYVLILLSYFCKSENLKFAKNYTKMLLLTIGVTTAVLLFLSVYLFGKAEQESDRGKVTIDELDKLPLEVPPVIVSQMKNGKVQRTLCYFSSYEEVAEPAVVEVDVRDQLLARLRPDSTIQIPA